MNEELDKDICNAIDHIFKGGFSNLATKKVKVNKTSVLINLYRNKN